MEDDDEAVTVDDCEGTEVLDEDVEVAPLKPGRLRLVEAASGTDPPLTLSAQLLSVPAWTTRLEARASIPASFSSTISTTVPAAILTVRITDVPLSPSARSKV